MISKTNKKLFVKDKQRLENIKIQIGDFFLIYNSFYYIKKKYIYRHNYLSSMPHISMSKHTKEETTYYENETTVLRDDRKRIKID